MSAVSYSAVLQGKAKPIKILKRGEPIESPSVEETIPDNEELHQESVSTVVDKASKREKRRSKNKPSSSFILSEFVFNANVASSSKQNTSSGLKPKKVEDNFKISSKTPKVIGNLLDSSTPQFHKGKYRENANKKPSTMKKIILKDREGRKLKNEANLSLQQHSTEETSELKLDVSLDQMVPKYPTPNERSIHSRKFRNYCDNVVSDELNQTVSLLITELGRFQDRQHAKDPEKAKLKRRMVCGLREVKKLVKVEKIRCLIVAPNLEKSEIEGGLNDVLDEILNDCKSQNVPYIFAMNRQSLGFVTRKRRPLSVVGILNYQGAEQHFKRAMELVEEARAKYEEIKSLNDLSAVADHEKSSTDAKILPIHFDISADDETSSIRFDSINKSIQVDGNLSPPTKDYSSSKLDPTVPCFVSYQSFITSNDFSSSTDDEPVVLVNNFQTLSFN